MNVNDLMDVWRSQDAFPLHGVNETLLRLALRQDDAKMRRARRASRWVGYILAALMVRGMVRDLATMVNRNDLGLSGWDYAIPVVGAAAALLWVRLIYVRHRAQTTREQRFSDSLRDQINRQIAQLEYGARMSRLAALLGMLILPIVWAFTTIFVSWRIHGRAFSDPWLLAPVVFMIGWIILMVGGTLWWTRRVTERKTLPRKRRLEALLRDVDGQ